METDIMQRILVLVDRLEGFESETKSVVNCREGEEEFLPGAASSTYGGRWG